LLSFLGNKKAVFTEDEKREILDVLTKDRRINYENLQKALPNQTHEQL
jgi:hypothetical protein